MKTVIVPVDFSETSLHAATYAAQWISNHFGVNLILFHCYAKGSDAAESLETLQQLKYQLDHKFPVLIEVVNELEDDFVSDLENLVRSREADLVIMGITGRTGLAKAFIGSNTLRFAQSKACPVLIVPPEAMYREVKNVLLASDFKNTENIVPLSAIKKFLYYDRPQLRIANVDPEHYISLTEQYETSKQYLAEFFYDFHPEFYFMRLYDVDEAIAMFAEKYEIDVIISIQHNYGLMDKLFKYSHTKSLSYQSNVPILVVHE